MRNEQQFSNLIYEYLLQKFHFQHYQLNDTLPTIDSFCREFSVSAQTVQTALKRLRDEGYITMRNGQYTKVIFSQSEAEAQAFNLRFFAERSAAFADLSEAGRLIWIPLLIEGMKQLNANEIHYLSSLAECTHVEDPVYFYCFILQKLENPLAMNLFWEFTLYQGFPITHRNNTDNFYNLDLIRQGLKGAVHHLKIKAWPNLLDQLLLLQDNIYARSADYIQKAQEANSSAPQLPFRWRIYRERPQHCYSLAVRMMHDIYLGEYRASNYLPSYEKMAEKYGYSISTIRRTIKLLNQLGTCRSENGKVTRIFTIGEKGDSPDFSCKAIRRNLAYFFQAFELIIYSCENVFMMTLPTLTVQQYNDLINQLKIYADTDQCELSLWCLLITIAEACPLHSIREIYGKLYGLFLWGHPLKANHERGEHNISDQDFTLALIHTLENKNINETALLIKDFVSRQFIRAENYLLKQGMQPEELRLPISFRLLVPAE